MNQKMLSAAFPTPSRAAAEALQTRFALRVAFRLTERSADLGPELTERLRFVREKALERARSTHGVQPAAAVVGVARGGVAVLGQIGAGWWLKAASVLPVFALAAGLFLIQRWQDDKQISTAAEVDAALLADDLPPRAYSDVGFTEFLKTPGE